MQIRPLLHDERKLWLAMRSRLWPDIPEESLAGELDEILADPNAAQVFVAALPDGALAGFIEASLRDTVEGCETTPVGYVEAWYVEPEHRRSRVGALLIDAAERWARERGCAEMASDTEIENLVSIEAHKSLGYDEVTRVVLFRKSLAPRDR